jgi:hypothetical protein
VTGDVACATGPTLAQVGEREFEDPIWHAFVGAMLELGHAEERRSRYADKPAVFVLTREIAHREGPGLIDLRMTAQGWADVGGAFADDPRVLREPRRRDWVELRLRSTEDLEHVGILLAKAVAANQ